MKRLKKNQTLYLVTSLVCERSLSVSSNIGNSFQSNLELVWIDGQVGVCPVFTNKKKAQKYAKEIGASVAELRVVT